MEEFEFEFVGKDPLEREIIYPRSLALKRLYLLFNSICPFYFSVLFLGFCSVGLCAMAMAFLCLIFCFWFVFLFVILLVIDFCVGEFMFLRARDYPFILLLICFSLQPPLFLKVELAFQLRKQFISLLSACSDSSEIGEVG